MAQVAGNKLIDARFIDETNYPASTSGDDIVSVVVDTCWGPCERPTVCDSATYQALFNPQGLEWLNGTRATVSRLFGMGTSFVEVLRLGKNEQWRFIVGQQGGSDVVNGLPAYTGVGQVSVESVAYLGSPVVDAFDDVGSLSGCNWAFRLRYAGGFPMQIKVVPAKRSSFAGVALYNIVLSAYAGSRTESSASGSGSTSVAVWRELESLQVTFSPLEVGGQSYFYADVINSKSNYLYCDVAWAYSQYDKLGGLTLREDGYTIYPVQSEGTTNTSNAWIPSGEHYGGYDASDYSDMYQFAVSRNDSRATVYVNSCIPRQILVAESEWAVDSDKRPVVALNGGEPIVVKVDKDKKVTSIGGETVSNGPTAVHGKGYVLQTTKDSNNNPVETWYVQATRSWTRLEDVIKVTDAGEVLKAMAAHVEGRMDCVCLAGFPTKVGNQYWSSGFGAASESTTIQNAKTWFDEVTNSGMYRFTGGIVGWEKYSISTIYGDATYDLDCTAGWAGRICSVAKGLRNRNQLPSYKAYGAYSGALVRTLSFDSVVSLHEDYGIGSVYRSTAGNYIFDVRSLWGINESYFARLNVMRVCAALLGNAFDIVEGVIHTDAAANRDNRLRLESRLNSLIGNMISRNELRSQSYADVGDDLNTDEATHGGRYLNINLVCWFIGLVERVNISVIATDSSVRAEITQVA